MLLFVCCLCADLEVAPLVVLSDNIAIETVKPGVQRILPRLPVLEALHLLTDMQSSNGSAGL